MIYYIYIGLIQMPTFKEQLLLALEECSSILLNPYMLTRFSSHYSQNSLYTTVKRIEKQGLIEKFEHEGKNHLRLTNRGKALIEKHRADSNKLRPLWDKRWRLVIFDIPEKKAQLRKYLRSYLVTLGFGRAQRSVWISPYDFRKEIRRYLLKLNLSEYVYQLLVEEFEGLSGEEIATEFWDLGSIHNKYIKFYRDWSERLNGIEEEMEETTDYDPSILHRYMKHLSWDYQAVLSRDPHLPEELLPTDWGGKVAREFIRTCRRKFPH